MTEDCMEIAHRRMHRVDVLTI
ncbi:MAG: hypothetical protein AVDCRST_MAG26-242, partial [uncultured Chloroflexia bacterium]